MNLNQRPLQRYDQKRIPVNNHLLSCQKRDLSIVLAGRVLAGRFCSVDVGETERSGRHDKEPIRRKVDCTREMSRRQIDGHIGGGS